ncbi:MAG TPA: ATP-binding protein [Frankiaceae bacterium]|nr:ATP-binding protein [Frankiaceae bacterium]
MLAVWILVAFVAGVTAASVRRRSARPVPARAGVSAESLTRASADVVVAALATGVVVLDGGEDVVWTNPAAEELRVTTGRRLTNAALAHVVRGARRSERPVHDLVDLGDGREVRASATRVPGSDAVALLVDDNTEARRIDAVRRDFVANVSHELNTPVGAISLLTEAIVDYGDDADARRRFAERLRVESARLSRLVRELIDLSRLQGGEPMDVVESVPVCAFISEAVDRTRLAALAGGIEVVVDADPALCVRGDERQLATAVANLLDNAVAYSPRGTRVAVSARAADGVIQVGVTDQGIGIAPRNLDRVFERFYRVDSARSRETGGTGLGLAIVKHIATNHGGRVDVWSVEGAGSTFTLTLPAASCARPAPPAREGIAS